MKQEEVGGQPATPKKEKMTIIKTEEGQKLTLTLQGKLDNNTAPLLEAEQLALPQDINHLVLDFEGLHYVSSSGLRVILALQKQMNQQGQMVLLHVNEMIMEVFETTGFIDVLTIG